MPRITEPNTYTVRVTTTALGESKQKASPQIIVGFADVVNGDTITAYLSCSEKAWQYTEEKLRNMGWDAAANGYRFEELNADPSPIAGNEVEIVVDLETYDNKTEARVKFINVPGGGIKRMDDGEASTFADRLRKQLGVSGSSSGRRLPRQTNSRSAAPAAEPAPEDDIPF